MINPNDIPTETLQRLIDFAHAAMGKRQDTPDEYPMNQSRTPEGYAVIYAIKTQTSGLETWARINPQPKIYSMAGYVCKNPKKKNGSEQLELFGY